jgi:hypothetical protein
LGVLRRPGPHTLRCVNTARARRGIAYSGAPLSGSQLHKPAEITVPPGCGRSLGCMRNLGRCIRLYASCMSPGLRPQPHVLCCIGPKRSPPRETCAPTDFRGGPGVLAACQPAFARWFFAHRHSTADARYLRLIPGHPLAGRGRHADPLRRCPGACYFLARPKLTCKGRSKTRQNADCSLFLAASSAWISLYWCSVRNRSCFMIRWFNPQPTAAATVHPRRWLRVERRDPRHLCQGHHRLTFRAP